MEAILDRLPLPRSRPAWMAAFILALMISLIFFPLQGWLTKLERNNYLEDTFPIFKGNADEVNGISVAFTLPRYMSTTDAYSFSVTIHNDSEQSISVDNLYIDVLLPVSKINADGALSTVVGPVLLSKLVGEYVLPREILPGQTVAIASLISPEEFTSLFNLIDKGIFLNFSIGVNGNYYQLTSRENNYVAYIIKDERQSLINSIIVSILATEKIFWFILGLSMFSCWIVEDKKFQDLWLNDQDGWRATFSTMLKGFGIFLALASLGGFVVIFNRFAVILVILFLTILTLWIFGITPKLFNTVVKKK